MNSLRIFIVSALPRLSDIGLEELRQAVERAIAYRSMMAAIHREELRQDAMMRDRGRAA